MQNYPSMYSTEKINEYKNNCFNAMKNNDINTFEYFYNIILSQKDQISDDDMALMKSYMLLYFLSENDMKNFYLLSEKLTYNEMNKPSVKLVISVERGLFEENKEKLETLKNICQAKEFIGLITKIQENLGRKRQYQKIVGRTLDEDKSERHLRVIKESVEFFNHCNK
ncbi:hypothetical protein SLOPH_641 [Spraguea lophii 42_110]|uniref:Uncharacterized protein n=1 Tax=Spraguea lophii (strain 42_110) TaxID=1358809 RepID=S7XPH1_SPRLO|nr:hypothetical protein SLOPH_641 [Spraguea lophii 42_110]